MVGLFTLLEFASWLGPELILGVQYGSWRANNQSEPWLLRIRSTFCFVPSMSESDVLMDAAKKKEVKDV